MTVAYSSDPARWALVPDDADASTWRLPLYRAEDTIPDPKLVAYAVGRMSPDATPTIPAKLARECRARIRAAWRLLHDGDPPAGVAKADDGFQAVAPVDGGHRGVMIALAPRPDVAARLALVDPPAGVTPEPVEQLHMTLIYLGQIEEWPEARLRLVRLAVQEFAVSRFPLYGSVGSFAVFDAGEEESPAVALVSVVGLDAFRARLVDCLLDRGICPDGSHGFVPHVTLGWGPLDAVRAIPLPPTVDVDFTDVLVVAAGEVHRFPLDGLCSSPVMDSGAVAVLAKAAEQRYTFAPVYVPGAPDSHGEFVTGDDLQRMGWNYLRAGDRAVRFWHLPDTVAGEVVEMTCWPYEADVTLTEADGSTRDVTLPAGTMYAGVVWEPWAWDEVRTGGIRAYSWGGFSRRRPVTTPTAEEF